jgi:hypothetical protein
MAFCNADGSISNWNAVGIPSSDMLLLIDEQCALLCERCYKSFMLPGFKDLYCIQAWIPTYPIQIIPSYLSLYCVISKLIAPQSPCSCKCYCFFSQMALISIWIPSLPTQHWLWLHHNLQDLPPTHSNTSCQHSTSLPAFPASNSCCHHGKRAVSWL